MNEPAYKLEIQNDQFICLIPNAIPVELCKQIIEQFELSSKDHYSGKLSTGYFPEVKKATNFDINAGIRSGSKFWQDTDNAISKIVGETWQIYLDTVEITQFMSPPFVDAGYLVQRYTKGKGYFKAHADSSSYELCMRQAGCIMYLNDVLIGGETNFPRSDSKISCRTGSLIWFPASFTHLHEGLIPISNDKYIITAFMEFGKNEYE